MGLINANDNRLDESIGTYNQKIRTSAVNLIPNDHITSNIKHRIADALAIRVPQIETFAMARYKPGQQYEEHVDWIHGHVRELAVSGQRIWTCLLYLNDL